MNVVSTLARQGAVPLVSGLALGLGAAAAVRIARAGSDDPLSGPVGRVEAALKRVSIPLALGASGVAMLPRVAKGHFPLSLTGLSFGAGLLLGLRSGADVGVAIDRAINGDRYRVPEAQAARTLEAVASDFVGSGIEIRDGYRVEYDPTFPAANGLYLRTYGPGLTHMGRAFGQADDTFVVGAPDVGGGYSEEILAHEMGHRIARAVGSEATAPVEWELAALGESLADVYAAGLDDDWVVGNDLRSDYGRSLEAPYAGQRPHMRLVDPDGDPHVNAGIPNHAAFRIGSELGRRAMLSLVHEAVTTQGARVGSLEAWAAAVRHVADSRYGAGSEAAGTVDRIWREVGL